MRQRGDGRDLLHRSLTVRGERQETLRNLLELAGNSGAEGCRFEPYRAYQAPQQLRASASRYRGAVVPWWFHQRRNSTQPLGTVWTLRWLQWGPEGVPPDGPDGWARISGGSVLRGASCETPEPPQQPGTIGVWARTPLRGRAHVAAATA